MSKTVFTAMMGLSAAVLVGCPGGVGPIDTGDTDEQVLAGNAVVEPCTVDFGTIETGETASQYVTVKNTGLGDLSVLSVAVEEPFVSSAQTPVVAQAGRDYQFAVSFEPGAGDFGTFKSELIIGTDDPDAPSIVCSLSAGVTDDADLDGFASAAAGGSDCNDQDASINPGAEEIWYDGVDQNCDGASDYDQDGDGFESDFYFPSADDVNPDTSLPGGDCQDVYASINPGMTEVWYDGTDSDCDGQNDFDKDGDGYRTSEFGYRDCNDEDPLANPEAIEAFNGADDDCNGLVDDKSSPERADIVAYGDDDEWSVGHGIAMDDVDGSGSTDIVIGCHYYDYSKTGATTGDAPGGVAIFWDNGLRDEDFICGGDEDVFIEGGSATDELGYEVITMPDFNGGGKADFAATAIGAGSFAGAVYVFDGERLSTSTALEDYAIKITGLSGYGLGAGLGTGDLNGDGLSDLIMHGGSRRDVYTYTAIQYGSTSGLGEYNWTEIDATYFHKCGTKPTWSSYRTSCGPQTGTWVAGGNTGAKPAFDFNGHAPADFNGDGYDDFLFGDAWSDDGGPSDSGSVWAVFGRRAEHTTSNGKYEETMTVVADGAVKSGHLGGGVAMMPDVDGDGADEMLIHDEDRSVIYMIKGSSAAPAGFEDLGEVADATFTGVSAFAGSSVVGDWTGDGVSDVVLTFGDTDGGGSMFLLPANDWSGDVNFDDAVAGSVIGDEWNVSYGASAPIYTRPLNDADSTSDLIVADFRYDNEDLTGSGAEGAVFVFYNQSL